MKTFCRKPWPRWFGNPGCRRSFFANRSATEPQEIRRRLRGPAPGRASHQEDALAGRLRVEQAIGLLGLFQFPAVGEQAFDIDLALGDETRAFALALPRKRPGCH